MVPGTMGFTIAEKESHEQETVVPGRRIRSDRRLRALAPVPPSHHPGHEDNPQHDRRTGGDADVIAGAVRHHHLAPGWTPCRPLGQSGRRPAGSRLSHRLSLIHISEPTRLGMISYAVFCLKKKKKKKKNTINKIQN